MKGPIERLDDIEAVLTGVGIRPHMTVEQLRAKLNFGNRDGQAIMDTNLTIEELKRAHHESIINIEEQVITMAAEVLDALIALDTRTNAALDAIETQQSTGLTGDEAGQLSDAMTATTTRAEADAGIAAPGGGRIPARRK